MKNCSKELELEELIESYSSVIRSICRKYYLVGGTEEDLFQEGMIGLFEAYKNYRGTDGFKSDKFKTFALICIKRQIYDAIKQANKKHNQPLNNYVPIVKINSENQEYERPEIFMFEDECSPEDIFIDKEEYNEKIAICKSKLSAFECKVLDRYLLGEKQSQIAQELGKDVKSIDNTIQRIKHKLKQQRS